jgi:hypothetical protein
VSRGSGGSVDVSTLIFLSDGNIATFLAAALLVVLGDDMEHFPVIV